MLQMEGLPEQEMNIEEYYKWLIQLKASTEYLTPYWRKRLLGEIAYTKLLMSNSFEKYLQKKFGKMK